MNSTFSSLTIATALSNVSLVGFASTPEKLNPSVIFKSCDYLVVNTVAFDWTATVDDKRFSWSINGLADSVDLALAEAE